MVDVAADLATGKALDMMESAPVLGFNARITGGGDYDPTRRLATSAWSPPAWPGSPA